MKTLITIACLSVLNLFALSVQAIPLLPEEKMIEQPNPIPYAKWGQLAIQETQKKYPLAEIVDYLHVGRKPLSSTTAQETFKLWLRQGDREFGVYVRITLDTVTEKVHAIQFEETDR